MQWGNVTVIISMFRGLASPFHIVILELRSAPGVVTTWLSRAGIPAAQAHTVCSPAKEFFCYIHYKMSARGISCPSPKHNLMATGFWSIFSTEVFEVYPRGTYQLWWMDQTPPKLKLDFATLSSCKWNVNLQLKFGNGIHGEKRYRKHLKRQIRSENDSVKMVSWHKFLLGLSDLMLFPKLKGWFLFLTTDAANHHHGVWNSSRVQSLSYVTASNKDSTAGAPLTVDNDAWDDIKSTLPSNSRAAFTGLVDVELCSCQRGEQMWLRDTWQAALLKQ